MNYSTDTKTKAIISIQYEDLDRFKRFAESQDLQMQFIRLAYDDKEDDDMIQALVIVALSWVAVIAGIVFGWRKLRGKRAN